MARFEATLIATHLTEKDPRIQTSGNVCPGNRRLGIFGNANQCGFRTTNIRHSLDSRPPRLGTADKSTRGGRAHGRGTGLPRSAKTDARDFSPSSTNASSPLVRRRNGAALRRRPASACPPAVGTQEVERESTGLQLFMSTLAGALNTSTSIHSPIALTESRTSESSNDILMMILTSIPIVAHSDDFRTKSLLLCVAANNDASASHAHARTRPRVASHGRQIPTKTKRYATSTMFPFVLILEYFNHRRRKRAHIVRSAICDLRFAIRE